MVLDVEFVSCVLEDFPNDVVLSFGLASIFCMYVSYLFWGGGGLGLGFRVFGLYDTYLQLANFQGMTL